MRCTPMAVFTAGLSNKEEILAAIVSDISMTHPHPLVHEAIYIYQLAIHHLLNNQNNPGRALEAFQLATESIKGFTNVKDDSGQE